ncbi:nucleoside monophosphate kinase [Candidatus Parcubacteria bacterium]|nr:nucleoside monophosphate kinase [Candidatus Parcubacteria bacterium]
MRIIILLGQPGAGKGTQGILLSEKLDLYYFETSKLIENRVMNAEKDEFIEADGEKYFLNKEKDLWLKGVLCSPPFATYLVKEKIEELTKEKKSILFSGSPRTMHEGEKIIPVLVELYGKENIKVINILLSAEQSIWRNSHRRICELMRHPILWNSETENLENCPLDGSKLLKRKGLDDPEVIKTRLKEYEERTLPLINYFKEQGLAVEKIKGEQTVAEVFADILKAIK